MERVKEALAKLLKAVQRSRLAMVGVIMLAIFTPVLLAALILDWLGGIDNPYLGFLLYIVLGPLCLLGLVFVVWGFFSRGGEDIGLFAYEYLREQLAMPGRYTRIRRFLSLTTVLAGLFLFLVALTAYTGLRYTDTVSFCGQFCHSVMEPEYTAYRNSPHSQVACVDCHIGAAAGWATKAKLTGVKQLFAVITDSYPRPIPTPLTALRPTRENCEQCHRPEKRYGHTLFILDHYQPDEDNTHLQSVLVMKVGSGGQLGRLAHGIHWHTSSRHQVFYTAIDRARKRIVRVRLVDADGSQVTFYKQGFEPGSGQVGKTVEEETRLMDCMDCHNRPSHIFRSPEAALDREIRLGRIPEQLPFIKRQALAAVTQPYASREQARVGIARALRSWYRQHYPELARKKGGELLRRAIQGATAAYLENVFPAMNIQWNTYDDFLGHRNDSGCFRCHDGSFRTPSGRTISNRCDACHILLADRRPPAEVRQLFYRNEAGHP